MVIGSSTIGSGVPSGVSLSRPICAMSDSKVRSSEARTLISSVQGLERLNNRQSLRTCSA